MAINENIIMIKDIDVFTLIIKDSNYLKYEVEITIDEVIKILESDLILKRTFKTTGTKDSHLEQMTITVN